MTKSYLIGVLNVRNDDKLTTQQVDRFINCQSDAWLREATKACQAEKSLRNGPATKKTLPRLPFIRFTFSLQDGAIKGLSQLLSQLQKSTS